MSEQERRPLNIVCMATYFKGVDFIRECKAHGCNVILITKEKTLNEEWPRESLDDLIAVPNDAGPALFIDLVAFLSRKARLDRVIALEELTGIRQRVKARRQQRPRHANWGFSQLRQYVTYKGALAGVPVILVDPRHAGQQCNHCGHIAKANRPTQNQFSCHRCGYKTSADFNAAQNIKNRAAVNRRMVAQPRQLRLALA